MNLVRVHGKQSLPVFQVEGHTRKFVMMTALALKLRLAQVEAWSAFCEANTTEFWRYVPWVIVRENSETKTNELEIPLWGTEPTVDDFSSGLVYADANWAWDVLTLHKFGVRNVSGSKHFHGRWQGSPCGHGNFDCRWKSVNPRSASGIYGYSAVFAHSGKAGEIIEVPKGTKWYQPPARHRPRKGSSIPEGHVLDSRLMDFSRSK